MNVRPFKEFVRKNMIYMSSLGDILRELCLSEVSEEKEIRLRD